MGLRDASASKKAVDRNVQQRLLIGNKFSQLSCVGGTTGAESCMFPFFVQKYEKNQIPFIVWLSITINLIFLSKALIFCEWFVFCRASPEEKITLKRMREQVNIIIIVINVIVIIIIMREQVNNVISTNSIIAMLCHPNQTVAMFLQKAKAENAAKHPGFDCPCSFQVYFTLGFLQTLIGFLISFKIFYFQGIIGFFIFWGSILTKLFYQPVLKMWEWDEW